MGQQYDTVSFLSDYGTADEFVGVVHSVIRSIAPHVGIVDLSHDVEPFDVRAASLMLIRSANYLCPGVVLAVVDPAVGTARRAIAVEVGDGESVLVGPDNGLLAPVAAMSGGASRVVELTNEKYQLESDSRTFAGRDVFAPCAAHLCNGVDLAELGPLVDASQLVPGTIPFSAEEDGVLGAEVLWIDRYGNAQLNVTPEQLEHFGEVVAMTVANKQVQAKRVRTFADLAAGEAGLVVDSSGLISFVLDQGSVAERYQLSVETTVSLTDPSIGVGELQGIRVPNG